MCRFDTAHFLIETDDPGIRFMKSPFGIYVPISGLPPWRCWSVGKCRFSVGLRSGQGLRVFLVGLRLERAVVGDCGTSVAPGGVLPYGWVSGRAPRRLRGRLWDICVLSSLICVSRVVAGIPFKRSL